MNLSQMQYYKQQKGYSFAKLAELSGVPQGTIQKIFSGETKSPRYDTLQALEAALRPDTDNCGMEFPAGDAENLVREAALQYGNSHKDVRNGSPQRFGKPGKYTLDDYYALPEERRVELIDGVFYDMAAPTTIHQMLITRIGLAIQRFIDDNAGDCMMFMAPTDVQLDCDDRTMVQPDIAVLYDRKKLIRRCIMGAPDFIIEILSPSTRRKDAILKLMKYREAGVREYWIVDAEKERILAYYFEKDELPCIYGAGDSVPVGIYDGRLALGTEDIFKTVRQIRD